MEVMAIATGKTILIVDDEPDVLSYLGAIFEENGFTAISAANGKEGFEGAYFCSYVKQPVEVKLPGRGTKKVWKLTQVCQ